MTKTSSPYKSKVKRKLKYLDEWCQRDSAEELERWAASLKKGVRDPKTKAGAAQSLLYWAFWHSQHGLKAVLDGDASGWNRIELAYRYRRWHIQIYPKIMVFSLHFYLLAHALLKGRDADVQAELAFINHSQDYESANLWDYYNFGKFELYLLEQDGKIPVGTRTIPDKITPADMGAYGPVIERWAQDDGLAEAIQGMLDYHCDQALSGKAFSEFEHSPYGLIPIDYLVLKHFRDRAGLPTPDVAHPLLIPELMAIPDVDEKAVDALVDAEVRAYVDAYLTD